MKIIRFILPFLFIRNWYSGEWEISRNRLILFCGGIVLLGLGLIIVHLLQAPVLYSAS